jgi:enamine deaminase RidA (YjgF/YER057c/UK114 family)
MLRSTIPFMFLGSVFLAGCAGQGHAVGRTEFHLGEWEQDIGYSQAVRVGNTLHTAGSAAGGPMTEAIPLAYATLEKTLSAHGLTFKDVVKETVFTTDIEALKQHRALRSAYYGSTFPAATWVQIQRLYDPAHVIEVELVAVFPE